MRRRRVRPAVAGLFAFVLAVAIGVFAFGGRSGVGAEAPADPSTLQRIAQENDNAATLAAARMKAESRRSTAAADALAENQAPSAPAP